MKIGKYFLHNDLDVRGKKGQMVAAEQINVHSVVISFPKEKILVESERLAPLFPSSSLELLQCYLEILEENGESSQEHLVLQSNLVHIDRFQFL